MGSARTLKRLFGLFLRKELSSLGILSSDIFLAQKSFLERMEEQVSSLEKRMDALETLSSSHEDSN